MKEYSGMPIAEIEKRDPNFFDDEPSLVERLRAMSQQGYDFNADTLRMFRCSADALEAKDAEIERLRNALATSERQLRGTGSGSLFSLETIRNALKTHK